jgi:hypothetical protein
MHKLEKRPYLRDRWIVTHPKQFYVITPVEFHRNIPISCPVCETLLRSKDDEDAYEEFSCCHRCSMAWASSRREKWKDGWRPAPNELKLEVSSRPPLNINFKIE